MKRLHWIILTLSFSFTLLGLTNALLTAQAAPQMVIHPTNSLQQEPPPLGEPCGSGEQLPPWVLCFHGIVALQQPSGERVPLVGVPVTVTFGEGAVTGTTAVAPGMLTPTFGLDISPLEPLFLQPVTVTAVVSGTPIQHQVSFFPDFRTQNQRYDFIIPATGPLDRGQLWGYVVDFGAGGPVTQAVVTVDYPGGRFTATTTTAVSGSLPIYSLDTTAVPGTRITLTAHYQGDTDQQVITLPNHPSTQLNFVTGWKCDDFDPLPRTGAGDGLPRTGAGDGLPDVACFWGHVVLNGQAVAGARVFVEVGGETYEGYTKVPPGEEMARFGIGLWNREQIENEIATFSSVFEGITALESVAVTLDEQLSQRVDLPMHSTEILANLTSGNEIWDFAEQGGYVWVATKGGGVVRWNRHNEEYVQLTTLDGLSTNFVTTIAADAGGNLWFGSESSENTIGVNRYSPVDEVWTTFTPDNSGLADKVVYDISTAGDGNIYFAGKGGVSIYDPISNTWETLTDTWSSVVKKDTSGRIWVGRIQSEQVSYYDPGTDRWVSFNLANFGIANGNINSIEEDSLGGIWVGFSGGNGGLGYFHPVSQTWQVFTTAHGLSSNNVYDIHIDAHNHVWGATSGGVNIYNPITDSWKILSTAHGLIHNQVRAVTVDTDGTAWFGTLYDGISRYHPQQQTWEHLTTAGAQYIAPKFIEVDGNGELWLVNYGDNEALVNYNPISQTWRIVSTNDGLANDDVLAIAVDPDGNLWAFHHRRKVSVYDAQTRTWSSFDASDMHGNGIEDADIDETGDAWVVHQRGYLSHYDIETQVWTQVLTTPQMKPYEYVIRDIHVVDGYVYVAPYDSKVSRYNPATQSWEQLAFYAKGIANDRYGNIWFSGSNVYRYNPATGTSQTYGMAGTTDIAVDMNGDIWVGIDGLTASPLNPYDGGLRRYNPDSDTWKNYGIGDGLVSSRILKVAADPQGYIWAGGYQTGISQVYVSPLESDLKLQAASVNAVYPGQTITYSLTFENQGQVSAFNTSTVLTLPHTVTFITATLPTTKTNPLTWNLGHISADASVTLSVIVSLPTNAAPGTIFTTTAHVTSDSPEAFLVNNTIALNTWILDPDNADARIAVQVPSLLIPGELGAFRFLVDNVGGLDADNSTVTVFPDAGLQYVAAAPPPVSQNPLLWDLGVLPGNSDPVPIVLTMSVDSNVATGDILSVTGSITTTTSDSNLANNAAAAAVRTSLDDARTLFLVAPGQLAAQYGASQILDKLYAAAMHPQIEGVVVNVTDDPAVANAYAAWKWSPESWQAANDVATAIKVLIDNFTITYPNLRYLVLVGGDDIIPFYRVPDQNPTVWDERRYARLGWLPQGTVRQALAANMLLTDDFYADRQPTTPSSPFWYDGHDLYLPDFAVGRLVETPEEIEATLDLFLQQNGRFTLTTALNGTFRPFTHDLGQTQCEAFTADGIIATCTNRSNQFQTAALNNTYDTIWSAFHSDYNNMGLLSAHAIQSRATPYTGTLFASIGCHAGLNVAGSDPFAGLDSAQAILGQRGLFIAPLTYAYASRLGVGYGEAIAHTLQQQLLITRTQTLGQGLVQAKQLYYAEHAGWFDYLDEKTVLPLTLYGLPMWQVDTPDPMPRQNELVSHQVTTAPWQFGEALTITVDSLTFTQHITDDGRYFAYQDQVWAQEGKPLQPQAHISVPAQTQSGTLRTLLLLQADYTTFSGFDPLLVQSWALGETHTPVEPPVTFSGYDREWPYALGHFQGLSQTVASLNLAPGRYHAGQAVEQLFDSFTFRLLYSDHPDTTPPHITSTHGYDIAGQTQVQVQAGDETGMMQVIAVCDTGAGQWDSVTLVSHPTGWHGICPQPATQFFVQVVDAAGNNTRSAWQQPVVYGLDFTATPATQTALHGQTLTYTLSLTNQGVVTATFQVALPPASWPITLPTTMITVAPGMAGHSLLHVAIPDTVWGHEQVVLPLTTTLVICPVCVSATETVTAVVTPVHGLALTPTTWQKTGEPGAQLVYTVTLTNLGNVTDTVTWTATDTASWRFEVPVTTTLLPWQAMSVPVTLTVPVTAVAGAVNSVTLTVVSQSQPSVLAQVTVTATASQHPSPNHMIYLPIMKQ